MLLLPEERADALNELLQGEGWNEVVRPVLVRRMAAIGRKVMTMTPPDGPAISRLQGEYCLLHSLLNEPERVLLDEETER